MISDQFFVEGTWDGFYTYYFTGNTQHPMPSYFSFGESIISGNGTDDISSFTWAGVYNESGKVKMVKSYSSHKVLYLGDIDENGIWGTWDIDGIKGGFHLWPKKAESIEEVNVEAKKNVMTNEA